VIWSNGRQEIRLVRQQLLQSSQLQVKIFVTTFDKVNRNQACFQDVTSMNIIGMGGVSVCMVLIKYNKTPKCAVS